MKKTCVKGIVVSLLSMVALHATATVDGWGFFKLAEYEQQADNTAPTSPAWTVYVSVNADPGDAGSVSINGSGLGSPLNLFEVEPGIWEGEAVYAGKPALDAAFPAGATYTISLSGGALGSQGQDFVIPADDFPSVPYLTGTVFSDFQAVDASQAAYSEWNEPGNTALLSIFPDSGGGPIFEEEDTGDIEIPAGTLYSGSNYAGNMERFNRTSIPPVGFGPWGSVGFISLVAFDIITIGTAAPFDDFNDNSRDASKWLVVTNGNGTALTEINQRLEFTSPSTASGGFSVWEWIGTSGSYTQDWVITYDTANYLDEYSISENETWLGMGVYFGSFDDSFGIDRNKGNEPGDSYHTIVADSSIGGVEQFFEHRSANSDEITFAVAFDAKTKTLYSSYDEGGGFVPYTNLNITAWGMGDSDEFDVILFGGCEGMEVLSGEVYGDNFLIADSAFVLSNEVQIMDLEYVVDFGNAGEPGNINYWFDLEVETSYEVVSVHVQMPGGLELISSNPWDTGSGFEYELDHFDSTPLDSELDGEIVITFGFSDGSYQSTILPFTLEDGTTPIPPMVVEPSFISPSPLAGTVQSMGTLNLQWPAPQAGANFNELGNELIDNDSGTIALYGTGVTDNLGYVLGFDGPLSTTQTSVQLEQGFNLFGQYQGYFRSDWNDDGIPYAVIKLSEVTHEFFVSSPTAYVDDFNDNSLDPAQWGLWYPNPGAGLSNANARLEYSSPAGVDGATGRQWLPHQLSTTQDWTVVVSATFLSQLDNVELTLGIESATNAVGMKFGSEGFGEYSVISQAFDVTTDEEHFFQWDTFYGMSETRLRIDYDAAAKTFTTSIWRWDEFEQLAVIDASGWGLGDNEKFDAILYVDNSGTSVFPGEAYFDSFMIWWGDGIAPPGDSDYDGLPDAWEIQYFGSISHTNANPDADPDADGNGYGGSGRNWAEWIMGTDPTNANSILKLAHPWEIPGEGFVIDWEAVTGRVYSVEWTDSLTNSFQTLEAGITHPQNSYTDTTHNAESVGYYNLKIQLEN